MNPILRNILAVIAGFIVGNIFNMGLIIIGMQLIQIPGNPSPFDPESIKAAIPQFEVKHFAIPLLAHAAGTLAGALVAVRIGISKYFTLAMIVGSIFLIAGILNALSIPAPAWFVALDLIVAYIPMAWLGWKLSGRG